MFPWLTLWTQSREKAFGGGPTEPLGTAQACSSIQQAPCTLHGFGDPPGCEDSLGADLQVGNELTMPSLRALGSQPLA